MFRCRPVSKCSLAVAATLAVMAVTTIASEAHAQSCNVSLDCPDTKPICSIFTHQCGDCALNTQCILRDLSLAHPTCSGGDCVGCASNADCGGNTPDCDPLLHICEPGICVGLSLLEHGIVDVSVAVTGVVRLYACVDGYTLVGTSQTTCQANGLFSGTPPECVPVAGYCEADLTCGTGQYCEISNHKCVAKLGNGGGMPTDSPHGLVTLDGTCNLGAALIACQSGTCDSDNKCGYANSHGVCTPLTPNACRSGACGADLTCGLPNGGGTCDVSNATTICRSGACSVHGNICIPAGGCGSDDDCGTSQWCNPLSFACESKVPNGSPIPGVPGHIPDISLGLCVELSGEAICASNVCSTTDSRCGYVNGEGPCTTNNAALVCRSGHCSAGGVCDAAPACDADIDCASDSYCSIEMGTCMPKIPNGAPLPNEPNHVPAIDGTCNDVTAAAVCQSGRCGSDNNCGLDVGEGPCSVLNAGVCRSNTCSAFAGTCAPAGGCILDADCAETEWCSSLTFTCYEKLPNGAPIPTIPGHVPTLVGLCIPDIGLGISLGSALCQSGVCDSVDSACGYAPGHGTCTADDAATVCRTGVCDGGVCGEAPECTSDLDCDLAVSFCSVSAGVCIHKLPNGTPLPSILGLDLCNDIVGALVCESGVCDTVDNKCGYKTGRGPCTDLIGGNVCRSGICAEGLGLCVECESDAQCGGSAGSCDLRDHVCVQCSIYSSIACVGSTPVCDFDSDTCGGCDGDFGAATQRACRDSGSPYCASGASAGACGRCAVDADCAGHSNGPRCDVTSGACVPVPTIDNPPTDGGDDDGPVVVPPTDGGGDEPAQDQPAGNGLEGMVAAGSGCAAVNSDGGLAALMVFGLLFLRRRNKA